MAYTAPATTTMKQNMIIPEVLTAMIDQKLVESIKFAPLAVIDNTLVNKPGDTVTMPSYQYIGDAQDVPEGHPIPISLLETARKTVSVKKAGRGVELTDEAILSGYGDPVGEAAKQLRIAIAQKIDNDCKSVLEAITAPMTHDASASVVPFADTVADALVKFEEDVEDAKVLFIAPSQLAVLRKDPSYLPASDVAAQIKMSGYVGSIHGCDIVLSNKVTIDPTTKVATNFIIKPGALAIFLKRETMVETDRDIITKTNIATVDKHYVAYLYDESKAVKVLVKMP